jgi:MYXO-CTERM domain-containing protein
MTGWFATDESQCFDCPAAANADQADEDMDGVGDACDPCPGDPANDVDGDGICGAQDNCAGTANPEQSDADGDGVGDACELAEPGGGGCGCAASGPGGPSCVGVLMMVALALSRFRRQ